MEATDREGVIRELLGQVKDGLAGYSEDELFEAVVARENEMPTGVGKGVALPHALIPGLDQVHIAVGFSRTGVDFRSPDGEMTAVAVLILFPQEAHELRIRILAQLSRLLRTEGFSANLISSISAEEVISLFRTTEELLDGDGA